MPTVSELLWGLIPQKGIYPYGLLCMLRQTFGCAVYGANWVVFYCSLNPTSGGVVFGVSWEGLHGGQF